MQLFEGFLILAGPTVLGSALGFVLRALPSRVRDRGRLYSDRSVQADVVKERSQPPRRDYAGCGRGEHAPPLARVLAAPGDSRLATWVSCYRGLYLTLRGYANELE